MSKATVKVTGEVYRVYLDHERRTHVDYPDIGPAAAHAFRLAGENRRDVRVDRVTFHEPLDDSVWTELFGPRTETITGTYQIPFPHFTEPSLSRYHPNNGWVIPETIEVES